ncbi:MAG TPA: EthD family reductase [Ilumatobacter sp.]|nr:EthD family reductase [Ilumatobacter sp.]
MITVSILYPQSDGTTFDMDYYTSSHMPMLAEALGEACQGWGVADVMGNDYHAIAWATVTSADAFNATMKEHGAKIIGDVPNYTNVAPVMLMGEVVANG